MIACNDSAPTPAISGTPTPVMYRPSINVTRADYNRAVALWQAQGITEYEITVNELSLRSNNDYPETMRVSGDTVTFLRSIMAAPVPYTISRADLEDLGADNTVDGLFDKVANALNYAEQETDVDSQIVFVVRFDPTFGYASYFEGSCEERKTPQPRDSSSACPSDTYLRVQTSDFKVLKRSASPVALTPTGLP
ncbi:MAG TPA: hypothetical protein VF914_13635 [Chloroflexia bacterium]